MGAYYNEHDAFVAIWLRELIKDGLIAPGIVDERNIQDVQPADLAGFSQCHFFAGIGVWSYALRNAGWPDDSPVWTGSCPCQGFSASGKRGGFSDQRHLWPAWFRLIRECRPHVCFGEQVASGDGLAWLDVVFADLEGAGYTCGAADTCAAGFGAPHIRQRLYFVADSGRISDGSEVGLLAESLGSGWDGWASQPRRRSQGRTAASGAGEAGSLADTRGHRREQCHTGERSVPEPDTHGTDGELGNAEQPRFQERKRNGRVQREAMESSERQASECPGFTNGFWRNAVWLPCRDGKYRSTQPGLFPLATGIANRVGTLRGAGNALCAPQAEAFVRAYREVRRGSAT